MHISLQLGKFDCPDRLFYFHEFLKNNNGFDLVLVINRMSDVTVVKDYIDMPEYRDLIKSHCANFGISNRASNTHSQSPAKFEGRLVTEGPKLLQYNINAASDRCFIPTFKEL